MIKLDNEVLEINKFPDGTLRINPHMVDGGFDRLREATITWHYESNEEMAAVMFLARHLQNNGVPFVHLVMPYIPNARQDRVKSITDVFTLKYFAEFINNLCFSTVTVLDPHSSVSEALFDNIIIENPKKYIHKAIESLGGFAHVSEDTKKPLMAFYPDEGAMKRYSGLIPMAYAFGIKKRDWETGKILGLDAAGSTDLIPMSDVLIIDDISSRGGTFYHSAKKLKELGANHIYLYITHCEHTIFEGEIFKSGLIDKVFTTNSIFGEREKEYASIIGVADKMEVFEYEKD